MTLNDVLREDEDPKKDTKIEIEKSKVLRITKRTVRFGSDVYQFHNITGFGVDEVKTKNVISIYFILVLFISGLIFAINRSTTSVGTTAILLGILGIIINNFKKKYGLQLYLNSGDVKVFVTTDKNFLKEVVQALYDFMESDKEGTYIVNIEDRSIRVEGSVGGSITAGDIQGNTSSYVGRTVSANIWKE